jgi:hypothetical protein
MYYAIAISAVANRIRGSSLYKARVASVDLVMPADLMVSE